MSLNNKQTDQLNASGSKYLELPQNVDKDPSVEHRLAVHGSDEVSNLLEGEGLYLLHYLHCSLHLLALKGHKGLVCIVQGLKLVSEQIKKTNYTSFGIYRAEIFFGEKLTSYFSVKTGLKILGFPLPLLWFIKNKKKLPSKL